MKKVDFQPNSQLKKIRRSTFNESRIESICFPPSLEEIGVDSFYMCDDLEKVEIPANSNLKIIDRYAFQLCHFSSINIPASLIQIDFESFALNSYLEHVIIPENSKLQKIGENAFFSTKITNIFIPASVVELEERCFDNLCNLKKIEIDPKNPYFKIYEDKILLKKSSLEKESYDILLFSFKDIREITIPESIEIISSSSFYKCNKLYSVNFPANSKLRRICSQE